VELGLGQQKAPGSSSRGVWEAGGLGWLAVFPVVAFGDSAPRFDWFTRPNTLEQVLNVGQVASQLVLRARPVAEAASHGVHSAAFLLSCFSSQVKDTSAPVPSPL